MNYTDETYLETHTAWEPSVDVDDARFLFTPDAYGEDVRGVVSLAAVGKTLAAVPVDLLGGDIVPVLVAVVE